MKNHNIVNTETVIKIYTYLKCIRAGSSKLVGLLKVAIANNIKPNILFEYIYIYIYVYIYIYILYTYIWK